MNGQFREDLWGGFPARPDAGPIGNRPQVDNLPHCDPEGQ